MSKRDLFKLVVIDDDLPIREELKRFNWDSLDIEFAGEAENGYTGLNLCRKERPDIIFLDIIMPVMDGLEMLKFIKDELPESQVVILTCHKDYKYMREALKMGVSDYILKTNLEDEEIISVIKRVKENLLNFRSESKKDDIKNKLKSSTVFREFLTTNQDIPINNLPPLKFPCIPIIILTNIPTFTSKIYNYLFESEFNKYHWFILDTSRTVMIIEDYTPAEYKKNIGILYKNISEILEHASLFIIQGKISQNHYELRYSYNIAKTCEKLIFYKEDGGIIDYDSKTFNQLNENMQNDLKSKISLALKSNLPFEKFIKEDFYNWAKNNYIDPCKLKSLIFLILEEWTGKDLDKNNEIFISFMETNCLTLGEFINIILERLSPYVKKQSYRPEVRQAISLIKELMHKPITLSKIANEVGLSPNYLNKLFIDETGMSFKEYLLEQRLNKAKKLLNDTSYKVYEIAEMVGIPNYRYFSFLFKNKTGYSPKEYATISLKEGTNYEVY
ncbi:MAG TPA: response regulator [Clostridiaceae bacterium]|nr:response regulator [Clostridiaceae bacterium]